MDHRKRWIAHAIKEMGTLEVDAGAARALTEHGRSLLPAGIVGCDGQLRGRRPGRGDLTATSGSPKA